MNLGGGDAAPKKTRKKWTRKTKEEEPEEPTVDLATQQQSESVAKVFTLAYSALLNRFFKDDPLTEGEQTSINIATTEAMKSYFPLLSKYAPLGVFVLACGAPVLARLDWEKIREKINNEKAQGTAGTR